jgi:hypothetical protein
VIFREVTMPQKDDWEKPRGRRGNGSHFTAEEVAFVEASFRQHRSARETARQLNCATRSINMRFRAMRGDPTPERRSHRKPEPTPTRSMPDRASRFYTSTFEL